jgi:Domain of unknown function (DUF4277)
MSETETYNSETLEHLGLVAGIFDELGIGDLVDELVPQDFSQRKVSVGRALSRRWSSTAWASPTGACT